MSLVTVELWRAKFMAAAVAYDRKLRGASRWRRRKTSGPDP